MNKAFSSVKTIFFDVTDTLYSAPQIDAEHEKQLHSLIAGKHNISTDEAKARLKEATQKLKATERHVTKVRSMAEFGFTKDHVYNAFSKVNHASYLLEDPKLKEVLTVLNKKYKLGIISNYTYPLMVRIFKGLGLPENLFPFIVTADTVKEVKPAHEPFLKAIELAHVKPSECLFVGDSPKKDMLPAKEVGMKTLLVSENPAAEDLKNADAYVMNVKEILSILSH